MTFLLGSTALFLQCISSFVSRQRRQTPPKSERQEFLKPQNIFSDFKSNLFGNNMTLEFDHYFILKKADLLIDLPNFKDAFFSFYIFLIELWYLRKNEFVFQSVEGVSLPKL